ncbi:arrestin domain-containing protein 3-like [Saccostrea cucullata]|uniref:arrestin domain-containing protein 3-like n=1 Tax=Saccostrea cuccullata TaxID=36930 RepID=UPI002ED09E09
MEIRELRVTFDGKAQVSWNDDENYTYKGHQKYFDVTICVFGKGLVGGNVHRLPPAQHVFPFTFVLPPQLPSSFEGEHGYVRYKVEGIIDRPRKSNLRSVRPFTVLTTLDLNLEPSVANGIEIQNSKDLCCLCCKSGPIVGTLKLNRTGYVPGESIYFEASAQNNTSRVCSMYADLQMVTNYTAYMHGRKSTLTLPKVINRIKHQDLPPGESEVWSGDRFVIPPLAPSYLGGCSLIKVKYLVTLSINPSGPSFNLQIPAEVIIGTIPLQSVVQQYQQANSTTQPSAPPLMPDPSFTESIWGPTNIGRDEGGENGQIYGQLEFTPRYSFYKR